MAVTGQKVVDVASKYVGYSGKKFWKDYGAAKGVAWCCIALWDFMRMAGASKYFFGGKKTAYVPTAQEWLAKNCAHVKMADAKAGDVVVFTWDGNGYNSERGSRDHIGLIRKAGTSKTLYSIEGNTSGGKVDKRTRNVRNVYGIYRPNYPKTTVKKVEDLIRIYINAGHSDTDSGAVSKYGKERTFNVKVRNACVKYLKANYKCKVYYNKGSFKDLKKICDSANKKKVKLFVSIHFNAGGGNGWEGLLYSLSAKHKALGKVFEKHVKAVGQNSRGLKKRSDLKVLKYTNMLAILNECAFIDNWKDIKDWNEDKELEKMGIALAKATAEYLKLPRK